MKRDRKPAWKWIAAGVGLALLVGASFFLPVGEWAEALQRWADARGPLGMLWFGLAYVLAVLVLVPASALTIAAGLAFGVVAGVAVVSLASTTAAALAFLIARHVARERLERIIAKNEKFRAFDEAIGDGDWKVVVLARLTPILPFNVSNYAFGLTRISFGKYVLASWLAMLPGTLLYVHLGAIGRVAGDKDRSPFEYALYGAGLLASIVLVLYVSRRARARMKRARVSGHGKHSAAKKTRRAHAT